MIAPIQRLGQGGAAGRPQRVRLADFTLATDPNSIIQTAADATNGVRFALKNSAASRDLPHTGACYVRPGVVGQDGVPIASTAWVPALRRPEPLIIERAKTGTDPILVRVGLLWMDTASPLTATEGFGFYYEYAPTTTLRRVGIVRVTSTGVWSAASTTTATGVAGHTGVLGSCGIASTAGLQGLQAVGTDINGDPAVPQSSNKATHTAVILTTAGSAWHTGVWAAWSATGGVDGVSVTFDPMYWLSQTPGRG